MSQFLLIAMIVGIALVLTLALGEWIVTRPEPEQEDNSATG